MLFNQHTPDPPRPHPQNSQPNRPQNLKLHPKQSASTVMPADHATGVSVSPLAEEAKGGRGRDPHPPTHPPNGGSRWPRPGRPSPCPSCAQPPHMTRQEGYELRGQGPHGWLCSFSPPPPGALNLLAPRFHHRHAGGGPPPPPPPPPPPARPTARPPARSLAPTPAPPAPSSCPATPPLEPALHRVNLRPSIFLVHIISHNHFS
jgi:hypothetical protein